jgi:sulfoacetaldehyde dehydrogenase
MTDNIEAMVARARVAQAQVEYWDQAQVDQMVAAAGWQVYQGGACRSLCLLGGGGDRDGGV